MQYFMKFEGGLGDWFIQMHQRGCYNFLNQLQPDDKAIIHVTTVNPFVIELFEEHPKKSQIYLTNDNTGWPDLHGSIINLNIPECELPLIFYVKEQDKTILNELQNIKYIVISAAAGLVNRNIPDDILKKITDKLRTTDYKIVNIGRNFNRTTDVWTKDHFERFDRIEPKIDCDYDLVDKLSVPGTAELIKGASAVITCHSAICHLAWLMKKPNIILYPEITYTDDFERESGFTFGMRYPNTIHGFHHDFDISWVDKMLNSIDAKLDWTPIKSNNPFRIVSDNENGINQSIERLYDYGKQVKTITEITDYPGLSTIAFLYSHPDELISYSDKENLSNFDLYELAKQKNVNLKINNFIPVISSINNTDLLFISNDIAYKNLDIFDFQKLIIFHNYKNYIHIIEKYVQKNNLNLITTRDNILVFTK